VTNRFMTQGYLEIGLRCIARVLRGLLKVFDGLLEHVRLFENQPSLIEIGCRLSSLHRKSPPKASLENLPFLSPLLFTPSSGEQKEGLDKQIFS
jgi:hypothetical protein